MLPGYNVRKAAQAVAFFALSEGADINVLKLSKLLYLAEREFMERFDAPMFYDRLVSMDHGPVTSISLNLINGCLENEEWSKFVADRSNYSVGIASKSLTFDDLDELSKADIKILSWLWEQFGRYDKYALRDYTHEHCKEWENPHGSSTPIPHERVFKFLNKKDGDRLSEEIEKHRDICRMFEHTK